MSQESTPRGSISPHPNPPARFVKTTSQGKMNKIAPPPKRELSKSSQSSSAANLPTVSSPARSPRTPKSKSKSHVEMTKQQSTPSLESILSPRVLATTSVLAPPPSLTLPGQLSLPITPTSTDDWDDLPLEKLKLQSLELEHYDPKNDKSVENRFIKFRVREFLLLIDSEKDYLEVFRTLKESYYKPLIESNLINEKDLSQIFTNYDTIYELNTTLYNNLKKIKKNYKPENFHQHMVKLFQEKGDFLKAYKQYALNQRGALGHLKKMKKNEDRFRTYLEALEKNPKLENKRLDQLLLLPTKRIQCYPDVFTVLVKYTRENDPIYSDFVKVQKNLNEISLDIIETEKSTEQMERLVELQSAIDGIENLVVPSRKLIKEGTLNYKKASHYIFLFNDLLLITTLSKRILAKKQAYSLVKQIWLKDAKVINVADSVCWNAFEIQVGDELIRLQGDDEGIKIEWFGLMRDQIKEYWMRKHHKDHTVRDISEGK